MVAAVLMALLFVSGNSPATGLSLGELAGTYRWENGQYVDFIVWREMGPDRLVAFDDSGRVRALTASGPGAFTAAASVAGEQPVAEVRFEGEAGVATPTRCVWLEKGKPARIAHRVRELRTEDVIFDSGPLQLGGTLYIPRGAGPHPALVLVHGSGAQDRNGTLPFAAFLVRHGIALLSYDKRGVGASAGDWHDASFADLANDALAAVAFLRTRPDIDRARIGLFGVSQGGWIGPLAASRSPNVALVVSVSGPGVTPAEQTLDLLAGELRTNGALPAEVDEALALTRLAFRYGREGEGWDEYAAAVARSRERSWFPYLQLPTDPKEPGWQQQKLFYFYDPAPALAALRCPLLAIFGGKDLGVPAEKNRRLWQQALERGGHRSHQLTVVPTADHLMWRAASGSMFEIAGLDGFAPEYRQTLLPWLQAQFRHSIAVAHVPASKAASVVALVGATLVDVSQGGTSTADVPDSVVVVKDGMIVAAGPRRSTKIPRGARVQRIDGAWVVPGLVDVFGGLNSQAQANAYLYKGVTTVVGSDELRGRRGELLVTANPGPYLRRLGMVRGFTRTPAGRVTLPTERVLQQIDEEVAAGARVLLLYYPLPPEQLRRAVQHAHELGLPTVGELGHTSYTEAIAAGVDAFIHTSRYSLELATPETHAAVADDPFGPPRLAFYQYLAALDPDAPVVTRWAQSLAASRVALMPTLSLYYYDLPEHENPWQDPIAAILDPAGIHLPLARETGKRDEPSGLQPGLPASVYRLEERYRRAGARYLAGSGAGAYGTLPGIALHLELRLLAQIGLTPRQALAAATSNVGEVFRWPRVGQVKPGYDADLLVVDADPTVDIRNLEKIRLVLLAGEVVDRAALLVPPATTRP